MVGIFALWLPVLLAGVAVFITSSIVHMLLPHHRNDFLQVPDEDGVMGALRGFDIPPGDYVMPSTGGDHQAMKSEAFQAKLAQGPLVVMTVMPKGTFSDMMGKTMAVWFAYCVLVSFFVAYATEKRRAKNPERFGRGAIEGVAAPESANNAAATSSFIPLLTIGLPANASMAMLFGALLILGISPGPQLVDEHPDVFWGVINSMYIGNILLLILSIPLVGLFVRILRVRPAVLAPITALITILGVYTINNSTFDIFVMLGFGVVGYLMKKAGFDPGPLVLAFVLGSIIESSTRRSLLIFDGDPTGFFTRPISGAILAIFLLLALLPVIQYVRRRRAADVEKPETVAR